MFVTIYLKQNFFLVNINKNIYIFYIICTNDIYGFSWYNIYWIANKRKEYNKMSEYESMSDELQKKIMAINPALADFNGGAIRRHPEHDKANLWRPAYIRDTEKIMHSLYYNRYADKTQVFSFYKNDDISHRGYHVQLVSRIARNIGRVLGLNCDLIEAIALGHDMGHTPFGHAGESFLNEIYHERTGRYFNHNVHSVRVLDSILKLNLSLQTLDGILCHNGESEFMEYRPSKLSNFDEFDKKVEKCYTDESSIKKLIPNTLEGCVVRISDIIAYIGKDRQDAIKTHTITSENIFDQSKIGKYNAAMINNLIVNILENSYGCDCIKMDEIHFKALKKAKRDNYELIYITGDNTQRYHDIIRPMFRKLYDKIFLELTSENMSSPVYKHHIAVIENALQFRGGSDYRKTNPDQITVDFIASMTDDYFIDLYEYYFGKSQIEYISYFHDTAI